MSEYCILTWNKLICFFVKSTMGSDDNKAPAQPLQLGFAGVSLEGCYLNNSLLRFFVTFHTALLLSTLSISVEI